jgi:hypothetical protein
VKNKDFCFNKMGPKKKPTTRAKSNEKFGGSAEELPTTDLPTHSDIARYFYLVCSEEKDFHNQIVLVKEKVKEVWFKCNSRLPLIEDRSVYNKLKRFLDKVRKCNRDKTTVAVKDNLLKSQDKLFDISACTCELPILACDSKFVRCTKENCDQQHCVCECPPESRIPAEDRFYMRDQRAKTGTRGAYQMGRLVKRPLPKTSTGKPKQPDLQRLQEITINPGDISFEVILLLS